MGNFYVEVGDEVSFTKTVGESDIYLFAGITGDFAAMHVNEEFMKGSSFGRRIAHGALLVGFMSTASSLMIDKARPMNGDETPVSAGYDRIRFVAPVFINDTVTTRYRIAEVEPDRRRASAEIEMTKQDGEVVAVATHILRWVKNA